MRWIPERAEALLHLRCIELNGEWDQFYEWEYNRWHNKLLRNEKVIVRSNEPLILTSKPTNNTPNEESIAA